MNRKICKFPFGKPKLERDCVWCAWTENVHIDIARDRIGILENITVVRGFSFTYISLVQIGCASIIKEGCSGIL